jgi:hypothetical protein
MPEGVSIVQANAGGARAGGRRAGTIPPGRGREADARIGSAAGGGGIVTASLGGNGTMICTAAQIGHQGALPNGRAGRRPDKPSVGSTGGGLRQRDASTQAGGASGSAGAQCANGSSACTASAATASREAAQVHRRAVLTPSIPAPRSGR